jgi:glycosyltransferase involved in cell wall biosynthesis
MCLRVLGTLPWPSPDFEHRFTDLIETFRASFASRSDQLSADDLASYYWILSTYEQLFQYYDVIQAYSTDTILPLLGRKQYFAFEHGTLRDIPFSNTPVGRTTAISYNLAQHVFVTNFDCLDNARALAGERMTLINHPYDEDHGLQVSGWEPLREALSAELDANFLFFFPTRHDWVVGTGYADKANDIFLRAFAELRRRNHRVAMVCCNWGSNVSQSKQLLDALGCARHVKWMAPMGMVKFERMARACHCVVDQFKLGAFGGVMFKAMAVGSPICTFLNESQILKQYPEAPPVINCRTEHEIVDKLSVLLETPVKAVELGARCRAWMKRYHSRDAVIGAQIAQYHRYHGA